MTIKYKAKCSQIMDKGMIINNGMVINENRSLGNDKRNLVCGYNPSVNDIKKAKL